MRSWSSAGAPSHFQSSSVNCVAIHVLEPVDSLDIHPAAWDDRPLQENSKGRLQGEIKAASWLVVVVMYRRQRGLECHVDQRGHL